MDEVRLFALPPLTEFERHALFLGLELLRDEYKERGASEETIGNLTALMEKLSLARLAPKK
jgi:hypothetical protein